MNNQHKIFPYRLNIKTLIFCVCAIEITVFSVSLFISGTADKNKLWEIVKDFGGFIAPVTFFWVWFEKALWHTYLFQRFNNWLNIPPDLRGRWEGELKSSLNPEKPRRFVLEVEQTLTSIEIFSYSDFGNSRSILAEIGSDEKEDVFSLCFFWQGEIDISEGAGHRITRFNGYTILNQNKEGNSDNMEGSYFTNLFPQQTLGQIQLSRVGFELKKCL
jgi:hypothetical protein